MTITIAPTPAISVRVGDRIRYDQDTWELVEREVQDPEAPPGGAASAWSCAATGPTAAPPP